MSDPGRIPDPKTWHTKETYKGLIALGQSALRGAAIINGGAAVAFLAFIGRFYDGQIGTEINMFWGLRMPMIAFVIGVVSAGLAMAIAYVMQFVLFNEEMGRKVTMPRLLRNHRWWLYLAFGLVVASILCFAIGALLAAIFLT